MLVLGRKPGRSVTLLSGGEVIAKVTVLSIRDSVIRLGWEAPDYINIVRTELLEERESEGET